VARAAQHYAARFAAKEAALKALQTGWSAHQLARRRSNSERVGRTLILFHGRARELYEESGAARAHLSIAHTTEHAIAEVILEK